MDHNRNMSHSRSRMEDNIAGPDMMRTRSSGLKGKVYGKPKMKIHIIWKQSQDYDTRFSGNDKPDEYRDDPTGNITSWIVMEWDPHEMKPELLILLMFSLLVEIRDPHEREPELSVHSQVFDIRLGN
uniref:Uncharacterized protein n=1 Tax=Tanacetum cinerariifolium TaxID=118510 RepID=A0A699HWA8_TANCI|nr:hypothetical protein [Tanacetum cinerariifolium]